jgi:hypothetical protein
MFLRIIALIDVFIRIVGIVVKTLNELLRIIALIDVFIGIVGIVVKTLNELLRIITLIDIFLVDIDIEIVAIDMFLIDIDIGIVAILGMAIIGSGIVGIGIGKGLVVSIRVCRINQKANWCSRSCWPCWSCRSCQSLYTFVTLVTLGSPWSWDWFVTQALFATMTLFMFGFAKWFKWERILNIISGRHYKRSLIAKLV